MASLYMSPNAGGMGGGGVAGSQPISTAVHNSTNKLWRSNSIFNLWSKEYSMKRQRDLLSLRMAENNARDSRPTKTPS